MLSRFIQGYWRLADWDMSPRQRLSFIKAHLELGITTVDHAHVYGNPSCESLFGEALKLEPALRQQLEIISKCGICVGGARSVAHYQSGRQAIIDSVEESLQRLGTDYLDVLLIHRPDFLMDADVVADTFGHLRQQGMVKHFGVSNFTVPQMSLLQSRLDQPLVSNQIEVNPINLDVLESGILEAMQEARVRPMAWSCLAGGAIFSDASEPMDRLRATLNELREELGLDAEVNDHVMTLEHAYPDFSIKMHCFLVHLDHFVGRLTEHKGFAHVSLNDAAELDWIEADRPVLQRLKERFADVFSG